MDSKEYDARLCSAELIVLEGDLKKYLKPSTPAIQQEGLQQRMAGALGSLNWLCRQYAALHNFDSSELQLGIKQLRVAFKDKSWNRSKQILSFLVEKMPLSLQGLRPNDSNEVAIQTGKEIYISYCQACHLQSKQDIEAKANQQRPAYSLVEMAKELTQKEFIARMIVGVHGTSEIALQNPLTDDDISGMYHFLLAKRNLKEIINKPKK